MKDDETKAEKIFYSNISIDQSNFNYSVSEPSRHVSYSFPFPLFYLCPVIISFSFAISPQRDARGKEMLNHPFRYGYSFSYHITLLGKVELPSIRLKLFNCCNIPIKLKFENNSYIFL